MNLSSTVVPKSDQLNADDLIAGPLTITITDVRSGSGPDQPVSVYYANDNGRPYKPCKSMRRVLIALWGADGATYRGKRLTLFRDPNVTFGKDETGGIRISHASGISEPVTMALTVTRGKRKPYCVLPLKDEPAGEKADVSALTDVGESKAREGSAALQSWWTTSLTVEQRREIGQGKLNDWKLHAQDTDEAQKNAAREAPRK